MTKRRIAALLAVIAALLCIAGAYFWGMASAERPVYSPDPNASSWSPSAPLPEDGQDGIRIPGYGTLVFAAGQREVQMTLYNPEENSCIFVYSLYIEGEDEPLYTSGGIEPGKAVQEFKLDRALEAGEYLLEIHIDPYDAATGSTLNSAIVRAQLLVQ